MTDGGTVEFDVVAAWTAEVLAAMDRADAVIGACRGSANPAALAWLAEALDLRPGVTLLDVGGGLGGPAAWAVDRYGSAAVTLDPAGRAAGWARRLFGLPSVVADASALPLPDGSVDAAWALGVVSTARDQAGLLAEARRVLRPAGRIGLLEYVRTAAVVGASPEGNDFRSAAELDAGLAASGFAVVERATQIPAPPGGWSAVGRRVAAELAARHPGAVELDQSDVAERRFAELLSAGTLATTLLVAEPVS